MEIPIELVCAQCGRSRPAAAFDPRFLHKPTRKTCASCRSGGRCRTQEELLRLQAADRAADRARWQREWAERDKRDLLRVQQVEQREQKRERAMAALAAGASPSTHTHDFWLYAHRQQGSYPEDTEQSGKWLVFVPVEQVDLWWEVIKQAVEAGQLGGAAKVSTARPNRNAINLEERVICVYTYDGLDRDDAMRVREALHALGVRWPCSYKLDSATLAGQYARNGARVSLYRV